MVCALKGETHAEDLFNEFKPNWKPPPAEIPSL